MARIAYGIPKTDKKDFLAYWLQQKGYPFLGLSYPLENPAYQNTYPEFTIQNWASQSCAIIQQKIQQNNLHPQVIILAWSMAGALARDLSIECAKQNIDIKAFISLSAVIDPYNWYQIMTNGLFWKYVAPMQDKLTPKQNLKIQAIFRALPKDLTRIVPGSHFFFVGNQGAQKTVDKMEELIQQIERLKKQLIK